MDILTSRSMEIGRLALGGLSQRQNAIASNVANVLTPDYQRKEVSFEDQLNKIINREDMRSDLKAYNSTLSPDAKATTIPNNGFLPLEGKKEALTTEQLQFLSQNDFNEFNPEVLRDFKQFDVESGNNVELEKEMTDMAKTGIKYNTLSTLEARSFTRLSEIIKSGS